MRQTTTPMIRITTNVDDLAMYDEIRIALYNKDTESNPIIKLKKDLTIDKGVASFHLTQNETTILSGKCIIEMRIEMAGNVIGFRNGQIYINSAVDKVVI